MVLRVPMDPEDDDEFTAAARDSIRTNGDAMAAAAGDAPGNADTRPLVVGVQQYDRSPQALFHDQPDTPYQMPNVTTVYEARQYLNLWRVNDPQQFNSVVDMLRAANFLGENASSWSSIETAWNEALDSAALSYNANPNASSDVFTLLYSIAGKGGDDDRRGPGGGGSSIVTLTDPGSAAMIVDQALGSYLGRTATDQEQQAFYEALNARERANPRVQSGSTVSGGFNPQAFAQDFARSQEGVGEYQAATTFLDAFIGSLANPTEVT